MSDTMQFFSCVYAEYKARACENEKTSASLSLHIFKISVVWFKALKETKINHEFY